MLGKRLVLQACPNTDTERGRQNNQRQGLFLWCELHVGMPPNATNAMPFNVRWEVLPSSRDHGLVQCQKIKYECEYRSRHMCHDTSGTHSSLGASATVGKDPTAPRTDLVESSSNTEVDWVRCEECTGSAELVPGLSSESCRSSSRIRWRSIWFSRISICVSAW